MKTLLLAEWIAPMDAPMLRDGALAFDQRIIEVGRARDIRWRHPDAEHIELGSSILLPGLVNAHTHLELSDQTPGQAPSAGFVEWLKAVRTRSRAPRSDADVQAAAKLGIEQCLRFGVTCVGDISQKSGVTRPMIRQTLLAAVSFGEIIAMGKLRDQAGLMRAAAQDRSHESARLRSGLTPHAPYTVEAQVYRNCVAAARSHGYPLATHLAESPDEAIFLSQHAGAFRELWESIGLWLSPGEPFAGGPIRYAKALGLLDMPSLLAHVNYCDDDELAVLAGGSASVVYCPRTHAYFGHPPHRWREMLAAGINVAIGTDSCASSPDLNLLDDLRLVHRLAPDLAAEALWQMVTMRGAAALGLSDRAGSLTAGKFADVIAFGVTGTDPLAEILDSDVLPSSVWLCGQPAQA